MSTTTAKSTCHIKYSKIKIADGPIALSVFMVNSDKLFQPSKSGSSSKATPAPGQSKPSERVVASPILSVTIENATITNLTKPVVFAFPVNQVF